MAEAVGQVDTHPTDLTPHSRADGVGAKVSLAAGWSRHKRQSSTGVEEREGARTRAKRGHLEGARLLSALGDG